MNKVLTQNSNAKRPTPTPTPSHTPTHTPTQTPTQTPTPTPTPTVELQSVYLNDISTSIVQCDTGNVILGAGSNTIGKVTIQKPSYSVVSTKIDPSTLGVDSDINTVISDSGYIIYTKSMQVYHDYPSNVGPIKLSILDSVQILEGPPTLRALMLIPSNILHEIPLHNITFEDTFRLLATNMSSDQLSGTLYVTVFYYTESKPTVTPK